MRQMRDRRCHPIDRYRAFRKPRGEGVPVVQRAPRCIEAQEIVNQTLKAPHGLADRAGRLGEKCVTEDASLLGDQTSLLEGREALSTGRATVAQAAAMAKAGHAACKRPAATEVGHFIVPQAAGTVLKPAGLRRRCRCISRSGPKTQDRELAGAKTEAVKVFGANRRMVKQPAANGLRQMPVELCRPSRASRPQHRSKVARWHPVGLRYPVQPARQQFARCRFDVHRPAISRRQSIATGAGDADPWCRDCHVITGRRAEFRRRDSGT